MIVLELNTPFNVSVVPRIAPTLLDVINLVTINENTKFTFSYELDWTMVKGRLSFTLPDTNTDYKAGRKYEVTILNDTTSQILYRGKLIVVKEGTNIQNYTPSTQTTQRFKTKA